MEVVIMVRQALLLSSLFIFLIGCQQQVEDFKSLNRNDFDIHQEKGITFVNQQIFTGELYQLHSNKIDTLVIQQFRNGKKHGVWKKFYPNHQPLEIRYYHNGKKEGEHFVFWRNGQLKASYFLKDDVYHGAQREWTQKGLLIKELNYHNGKELGKQRVWYSNGEIKSNYVVKNGRRYGLLGTKNCVNVAEDI